MNMSDYKKYEPFFGSWYITKELGQGSYGTVFEIERQELGMTYKAALKAVTIPSSQNEYKRIIAEGQSKEDASEYFRGCVEELAKEIALMAQMKGQSNIVSYEDHKVVEHTDDVGWDIFIRMELLMPLDDYIQQHSLTEQEVIKLGIDLCKALEICQKHKIIHRDVKPENIFISSTGDYKLGDFGIARMAEKTTGASTRVGTNAYMAPEVYRGKRYNSNVDIYSLGLVMYRLMNHNRLPFYPPAPQPISFQQREEALTKRISGAELPNPVDADWRLAEIIRKACAFDAEKRYESPVDMRTQLEALSNPSTVTNGPRQQGQPTIKKENHYESRPHSPAKEGEDKQGYTIPTAVACPQCGMINPIENERCENCGYELPQYSDMNARKFGFLFGENGIDHYFEFVIRSARNGEYKTETVACPYCGQLNPSTGATCAYCGNSLWNNIDYTTESAGDYQNAGDSEIDHAFFESQNRGERFDTKVVLAIKIGIAVAFLLFIAFTVLFSNVKSSTPKQGEQGTANLIADPTPDISAVTTAPRLSAATAIITGEDTVLGVRGNSIPVTWYRPEDGPCVPLVVFCHGFTGDRSVNGHFALLAHALAEQGVASLALDFPGQGDSDESTVAYTLTNCAADIDACIDWMGAQQGIDTRRVALVGHSMGGRIATEYLNLGTYADVVQALALWSPADGDGLRGLEFLNIYDWSAVETWRTQAAASGAVNVDLWGNFTLSEAMFADMEQSHPAETLQAFDGPILLCYTPEEGSVFTEEGTVQPTIAAVEACEQGMVVPRESFAGGDHNYTAADKDLPVDKAGPLSIQLNQTLREVTLPVMLDAFDIA